MISLTQLSNGPIGQAPQQTQPDLSGKSMWSGVQAQQQTAGQNSNPISGFFNDIGTNVQNNAQDFVSKAQDIQGAYNQGKQGFLETGVEHVGNVLGYVGKNMAELPGIKQISNLLSSTAQPIVQGLGGIAANEVAKPLIAMHNTAAQLYSQSTDTAKQALSTTDPQKRQSLIDLSKQQAAAAKQATSAASSYQDQLDRGTRQAEAVQNIAPWLLGGVEAKTTAENLTNGMDTAATSIKGGVSGAVDTMNSLTTPSPKAITPETPIVTPEQQALTDAQSNVNTASQAREAIAPKAVEAVQSINDSVAGHRTSLGEQFASDAADLSKSNPNLKLNLTQEQVDALRALKQGKNFSLPKSISTDANLTGEMTPELNKYISNPTSLTPTQAQDLIRELNRSTYKELADGSRTVDYQRVGITNEIKDSASQAFGKKWDNIYSRYAQGRTAIDKIDSFVNLDPKATALDMNNQLKVIAKQSSTPEGKLLLKQSIEEYKTTSGIDLSNPIKAIQQIAERQDAFDAANSELTQAQKDAYKAQRQADIEKLKGGMVKQTLKSIIDPKYGARRLVWGAVGIGVIYPLIRALSNAAKGK